MARLKRSKQARIGIELDKLIWDTKEKNKIPTYIEASDWVAKYLNGVKKKKKMKERIIREIEF